MERLGNDIFDMPNLQWIIGTERKNQLLTKLSIENFTEFLKNELPRDHKDIGQASTVFSISLKVYYEY